MAWLRLSRAAEFAGAVAVVHGSQVSCMPLLRSRDWKDNGSNCAGRTQTSTLVGRPEAQDLPMNTGHNNPISDIADDHFNAVGALT
ncbi:hypothetical protein BRAS3809_6600001 [Bradyrhizobium sp. STM 3809]|nr:hypothetical protein BRAS3809_6600001 [Bradyrhizobium sp. STM 3809]